MPRYFWLKRLLILGATILSLTGLLWPTWSWEAQRRLAQTKQRARAAGVVLTAADLRPVHVREEDNAAVLLQTVLGALRSTWRRPRSSPSRLTASAAQLNG